MSNATEKPLRSIIEWKRIADEKPDDDITVLLAFHDGSIEPGYHDEGDWRDIGNMKYPGHFQPVLWADVPDVEDLIGNAKLTHEAGAKDV